MNNSVTFNMLTLLTAIVALFLAPGTNGAYRHFVFESPADFEQHGFDCVQHGAAPPCNITQVENGTQLPEYFPVTWRSLPGPLMYIESIHGVDGSYFRLETKDPLPGDIISFSGEYYTTAYEGMIGCLNVTNHGNSLPAPAHPWPPAPSNDPPRWYAQKWLYVSRPRLGRIGFFVRNDRVTNIAIFRRLELVIDEESNMHLEILNLEHATKYGVECVSGDEDSYSYTKNAGCEIKSVLQGSYLPHYFNNASRNLTVPEGHVIMYVESSDSNYHRLLFTLPREFTQHPIGVISLRSIYYTETEDAIGYGPILEDPDSGSPDSAGQWISYDARTNNPGHWINSRTYEFQSISTMIVSPNSKIGFFVVNDQTTNYAVFTRLEIHAWYTYDSVICDPENPDPSLPTSTSSSLTGSTTPTGDWISTTDPTTMGTEFPTTGRSNCPTPTTTLRPTTTTRTTTTTTGRTTTTTTEAAIGSTSSGDSEATTTSEESTSHATEAISSSSTTIKVSSTTTATTTVTTSSAPPTTTTSHGSGSAGVRVPIQIQRWLCTINIQLFLVFFCLATLLS